MIWSKIKLEKICEIVSGATPKTNKPEYYGGEIPWVTPKDLSDQKKKFISSTAKQLIEIEENILGDLKKMLNEIK